MQLTRLHNEETNGSGWFCDDCLAMIKPCLDVAGYKATETKETNYRDDCDWCRTECKEED
jgi:hypothetical protein